MTDSELLVLTETAISNVLTHGQAVGALGQSWTLADLPELNKMRDDLKVKVNASSTHMFKRAYAGTVAR